MNLGENEGYKLLVKALVAIDNEKNCVNLFAKSTLGKSYINHLFQGSLFLPCLF